MPLMGGGVSRSAAQGGEIPPFPPCAQYACRSFFLLFLLLWLLTAIGYYCVLQTGFVICISNHSRCLCPRPLRRPCPTCRRCRRARPDSSHGRRGSHSGGQGKAPSGTTRLAKYYRSRKCSFILPLLSSVRVQPVDDLRGRREGRARRGCHA